MGEGNQSVGRSYGSTGKLYACQKTKVALVSKILEPLMQHCWANGDWISFTAKRNHGPEYCTLSMAAGGHWRKGAEDAMIPHGGRT